MTATQSTTGWGGDAKRAIDGNTSGQYKDNSCTHTKNQKDSPSWWTVDMKTSYFLDSVEIFNREDCCSDRLKDYLIYIGNSENYLENEQCGDGYFQGAGNFSCQLDGQYLTIVKPEGGILTLCEV